MDDSLVLVPKNWKDLQHYRDRKPAWIKLHGAIPDDFEYFRLPVASQALAPLLWLLAHETRADRRRICTASEITLPVHRF